MSTTVEDGMPRDVVVGPRTKGLRVSEQQTGHRLLTSGAREITGPLFSWPLLTLDSDALSHNITTVAEVCRRAGVAHAPHVKTSMSAALYGRQKAAGAWGASVATPSQLRTAHAWGARRILLANELVDPREIRWLYAQLNLDPDLQVWVCLDSTRGLALLRAGVGEVVPANLGVLIEVGLLGGRTGMRSVAEAVRLAAGAADQGFRVIGVSGYEGVAAAGTGSDDLDKVRSFCRTLRQAASGMVRAGAVNPGEVVISAGGSSYLDVVLAELPVTLDNGSTPSVIVRSGAYVCHDHGFCARMDPWQRIPGTPPLRPAAIVWAQVLSAPEPGLLLCGAGRRDVPYDIDLPVPVLVRRSEPDGTLRPPESVSGLEATAINDQHLFVRDVARAGVGVGDVLGLGISHPCTVFDKWRIAAVVRGDTVEELIELDF